MIFGNVTTIISQIYADMNRYHDSLNSVREFARFNSVPQNIGKIMTNNKIFMKKAKNFGLTSKFLARKIHFPKKITGHLPTNLFIFPNTRTFFIILKHRNLEIGKHSSFFQLLNKSIF